MRTSPAKPTRRTPCFDSLEQEAFLNLWRTFDRLRGVEDELFGRYALTAQQYNVLRLLRAADPAGIPTLSLAQRLVSRAPDITRMLDPLERRGLITRLRSDRDRRSVQVGITPAGIELLDEMNEPLQACHTRQLGHLTVAQLRELIALLRTAREPHEGPESHWS
ncbi:MAG TPA: MarR family transcriptional regulator [Planctomycetaceae bacterium]|nr:MarR family transcriptional regulator [Planctomycetaceae bacterium]HRE99534.1 MarR family transcriptional regulator [Pirellulaceae bacterium]